jgi:hypothetical protein
MEPSLNMMFTAADENTGIFPRNFPLDERLAIVLNSMFKISYLVFLG